MSGHSKWSTIKRAKGAKDAARGQLFSKLSRLITIAAKTGGGPDPDANFRLRDAIDTARAANMPKDNIERAIKRAQEAGAGELAEVVYEGFGPGGVGIIVEAATDNKNRTAQEIKNAFDRGEGSLGGPGSVSFGFEAKGMLLVAKTADIDGQILAIIDLGVEDIEETGDGIELYVAPASLYDTREKLTGLGFSVLKSGLIRKPVTLVPVQDDKLAERIVRLLTSLDELDDTQEVYTNADIPDSVISSIG